MGETRRGTDAGNVLNLPRAISKCVDVTKTNLADIEKRREKSLVFGVDGLFRCCKKTREVVKTFIRLKCNNHIWFEEESPCTVYS